MRALKQLRAQRLQCDLASIHFHLRRNLGGEGLLQSQSPDVQIAVRLNRQQRRAALRRVKELERIGIQDAIPRTLSRMRREPSARSPVESSSAVRSN